MSFIPSLLTKAGINNNDVEVCSGMNIKEHSLSNSYKCLLWEWFYGNKSILSRTRK